MRPTAETPRTSYSYRFVFVALALSILGAVGVAYYIYDRYVRFERLAAEHLPAELSWAARLQIEQAVVYEPFRQHLLPLFEIGSVGERSRRDRFESETTIELGVDLRELAFATTPEGDWLIVLTGHFAQEDIAEGTARMLSREGIEMELRLAPTRLVHQSGVTFLPAKDGSLILARSEALALTAAPARPPAFLFGHSSALEVFQRQEGQPAGSTLHLVVSPGDPFPARLDISSPSALTEEGIETVVGGAPLPAALLVGQLEKLQEESVQPQKVSASGDLSREAFDSAVARLAQLATSWFR